MSPATSARSPSSAHGRDAAGGPRRRPRGRCRTPGRRRPRRSRAGGWAEVLRGGWCRCSRSILSSADLDPDDLAAPRGCAPPPSQRCDEAHPVAAAAVGARVDELGCSGLSSSTSMRRCPSRSNRRRPIVPQPCRTALATSSETTISARGPQSRPHTAQARNVACRALPIEDGSDGSCQRRRRGVSAVGSGRRRARTPPARGRRRSRCRPRASPRGRRAAPRRCRRRRGRWSGPAPRRAPRARRAWAATASR